MSDVASPPAPAKPPRTGAQLILAASRTAPETAGVYRMLSETGEPLYVGKAKNLKKRVLQYAQGRAHSQRLQHMVSLTRAMEFVTTATETEALLLESNLIKHLKPRFNVVLRDDKSFAELMIRRDHAVPQIKKHRGAHATEGDYFGPFASTWAVNRTLNTLQKAFLIRSCSDSVLETRTRPCMLHQIKRCSAPCTGLVDPETYASYVEEAAQFLRGKSREVIDRLSREMAAAADQLDFERAARLRDRVRALAAIDMEQSVNPETVAEADVFALHAEGGHACVQVFFFRAGQNWGNWAYFPRVDASDADADILTAFIGQFYENKPIPRLILCSHLPAEHVLLADALALKRGRKVAIEHPRRGEKCELVRRASTNAREALGRRLSENAGQARLLEAVAEAFKLDARPERIEVYDNSHVSGTNAVGALIVAGPDGFQKSQYRKFNIRDAELTPGDDYGMMREVLRRRFGRLVKEEEEAALSGAGAGSSSGPPRPDLVLIDGGQGQLAAATAVMTELGVHDIRVVGIAKGPDRDAGLERFFLSGAPPFMLEPRTPLLYYLQRLRDEAHRFAIGSHRVRRTMDMKRNPLDEIDGVGPRRKQALLHAFGSAKGVGRASAADLAKVEGVNAALAERIYGWFRRT